jgi:hypothetical protein
MVLREPYAESGNGHNPPCGGNRSFDPEMVNAGRNVMMAAPLLAAGVPVLTCIYIALGAVMMLYADTYQEDCNCVSVTALMPGRLDQQMGSGSRHVQICDRRRLGSSRCVPG